MNIWTERILITVLSIAVTSVITYLISKVKRLAKKESAVENGVRALLRDRITQMATYCEAKEYIAIHERENLEGMFKEYEALGGNGAAKSLVQQVFKLPTNGGDK